MELTAAEFNERYPIGTPVVAYPGVRPAFYSGQVPADFTALLARTRSVAWNLGHGEPVVKVDGYAGGISLDHIDPTDEES